LCGTDTANRLGLRETCALLSPEALVLDTEIYHTAQAEAAGLDTNCKALAIYVVKAVDPRGHFLSQPHTRQHMHLREFSDLISQPKVGGGYRNPIDVAREKIYWVLANQHPEPLTENQQVEFKRILRAAEGEMG
jgi:trimethylamine--corrinoid protein Co-methyltransferase